MEREKIVKPMSVARHDFASDVTGLINNSGLPIFVVEDVLKEILRNVVALSERQLANDMRAYKEQLEKNAENGGQTDKP